MAEMGEQPTCEISSNRFQASRARVWHRRCTATRAMNAFVQMEVDGGHPAMQSCSLPVGSVQYARPLPDSLMVCRTPCRKHSCRGALSAPPARAVPAAQLPFLFRFDTSPRDLWPWHAKRANQSPAETLSQMQ